MIRRLKSSSSSREEDARTRIFSTPCLANCLTLGVQTERWTVFGSASCTPFGKLRDTVAAQEPSACALAGIGLRAKPTRRSNDFAPSATSIRGVSWLSRKATLFQQAILSESEEWDLAGE